MTFSAQSHEIRQFVRLRYRPWNDMMHIQPFALSLKLGLSYPTSLAGVVIPRSGEFCHKNPIPTTAIVTRRAALPTRMRVAFYVDHLPTRITEFRAKHRTVRLVGRKLSAALRTVLCYCAATIPTRLRTVFSTMSNGGNQEYGGAYQTIQLNPGALLAPLATDITARPRAILSSWMIAGKRFLADTARDYHATNIVPPLACYNEYVADINKRLGRASGDDTPLFAGLA